MKTEKLDKLIQTYGYIFVLLDILFYSASFTCTG